MTRILKVRATIFLLFVIILHVRSAPQVNFLAPPQAPARFRNEGLPFNQIHIPLNGGNSYNPASAASNSWMFTQSYQYPPALVGMRDQDTGNIDRNINMAGSVGPNFKTPYGQLQGANQNHILVQREYPDADEGSIITITGPSRVPGQASSPPFQTYHINSPNGHGVAIISSSGPGTFGNAITFQTNPAPLCSGFPFCGGTPFCEGFPFCGQTNPFCPGFPFCKATASYPNKNTYRNANSNGQFPVPQVSPMFPYNFVGNVFKNIGESMTPY